MLRDKGLLKTQARFGRTEAYSTVYRVHDATKIDSLETKEFLWSTEKNMT